MTLSTEEQIDAVEISEDILRAANQLGADLRHHIAHSDIELIQNDVGFDLIIAKALNVERQNADQYKSMFEDAVRQHNEQMARAEAAEAGRDHWRDISTAPKDGTRIILMWEPFGGVSEHVELGRWSERSGWVNTYGHAFTGYPTHWMPLPAAPKGGA